MINPNILIVDENDDTRYNLHFLLKEYAIIEASTINSMWEILETNIQPDCIIINISLSGGRALAAVKEISCHPQFQEIPLLFLADHNDHLAVEQGFSFGCVDYIRQPFHAIEICARISAAIRRHNYTLRLKKQLSYDPLTGLLNRNAFHQKILSPMDYHRQKGIHFSLAMLDLDNFKEINDNYGHLAGDLVLHKFSQLCMRNLRQKDIIARYGGEEFIILLTNANALNASKALDRIRNLCINYPLEVNGRLIKLTFSGGIVDSSDFYTYSKNIEELISIADNRLYIAKNNGKNKIIYKNETCTKSSCDCLSF